MVVNDNAIYRKSGVTSGYLNLIVQIYSTIAIQRRA